jgi:hypothetical protein
MRQPVLIMLSLFCIKNNYYSLQQRFVTCLMYQAREELVYLIKSEE